MMCFSFVFWWWMMENKCKITGFNNLVLPVDSAQFVYLCRKKCNSVACHAHDNAKLNSEKICEKHTVEMLQELRVQTRDRSIKSPRGVGKQKETQESSTHKKKINKQVWSAFSATDSGRKLQVVLVFMPRIWKQAHNVWRQDWLFRSWCMMTRHRLHPIFSIVGCTVIFL